VEMVSLNKLVDVCVIDEIQVRHPVVRSVLNRVGHRASPACSGHQHVQQTDLFASTRCSILCVCCENQAFTA
jgi:hypothetical protein